MITTERKSNAEVLNKLACSNCYHSIDEHDGKCFGLEYDGTTYSACRCTQFKSEFKIVLSVPDDDNNNEENSE